MIEGTPFLEKGVSRVIHTHTGCYVGVAQLSASDTETENRESHPVQKWLFCVFCCLFLFKP